MCEDLEEKFSVNLLSSDTSVLVGRVGSSTVVITEDRSKSEILKINIMLMNALWLSVCVM